MEEQTLLANRYQVNGRIGAGGLGVVYRARDCKTGATVAIKHLDPQVLDQHPALARHVDQEATLLQQLEHPHIIHLQNSFTEGQDRYLVMPYVETGSLADLLRERPQLPLKLALRIALDLADALNQAHDRNIIHCDLKPSNVLLTPEKQPLLTDFGAAHALYGAPNPPGAGTVGTFTYMSPEACNGEPLDARADIWSFGIVLYEMLAGHPPFTHEDARHLLLSIMTEPLPDLQERRPEVSDRLADLIYRMLTKNREQRIPMMRLVGAELEHIYEATIPRKPGTGELRPPTNRFEEPDDGPQLPHFNLPYVSSAFVGREAELLEIESLLDKADASLITLHGPGGIGKTRLALQVTLNRLDKHQHGVYFVDLSAVDDPSLIAPAIADAIQFSFFGDDHPQKQLLNYLQNKDMLLVLDGVEQIVDGTELFAAIAVQAKNVKLIVTSQKQLELPQENLLSIRGLSIPDEKEDTLTDAVRLFLQNTRRVRRDYQPDTGELEAIRRICRLVEGLPLGIELAAAWMNTLSPQEIARQIGRDIDFLVARQEDMPLRHRSVRSVFEYAWRQLKSKEQRILRRLAVFRGGFNQEAAQHVAGAPPLLLNSLVNKALLQRVPATGRYTMPALLRDYAQQKLDEVATERTHTTMQYGFYYLRYVQQRASDLVGGQQLRALADIEREIANVRAAWQWAVRANDEEAIELALDTLYYFYQMRGRQREGVEVFAQAARALRTTEPPGSKLVLLRTIARQGAYSRFLGRLDEAQGLLEESLEMARELNRKRDMAFALYHLGAADPANPKTKAYWQESLQLAELIGDTPLIAEALNWLSFAYYREGEQKTAVSMLERSLSLRRSLKDEHGLAINLANLGLVYIHTGQYERARKLLLEGLEIHQRLNDLHSMANVCNNLSYIGINTREYDKAERWGQQALHYYREMGDKKGEGLALGNLSETAYYQGAYERARKLCQQCISLYESIKLPLGPYYNILGRVALAQNDPEKAQAAFKKALMEDPDPPLTLDILTGLTTLLVYQGETIFAAALLSFIRQHAASEQLVKERATRRLQTLTSRLTPIQEKKLQQKQWPQSLETWLAGSRALLNL